MQGTAATVLAAALSAARAAGSRMRDQRIVIYGAGTAGTGIADMLRQAMISDGLPTAEVARSFYALDRKGLLTSDYPEIVRDFQVPYVRPAAEMAGWRRDADGCIGLAEVVRQAHPTMLIGTSTQPGAFTEAIVAEMAAHVARPVIMPLSNPTSHAEARPADLIAWTGGRALIATGSPFEPVSYQGMRYEIAQANNALIFPGLGLGVTVARARRVSDGMLAAAADALAGLSDAHARRGRAAPGHQPAGHLSRGGGRRGPGRMQRGPGRRAADRSRPPGPRGHVGARLPPRRSDLGEAGTTARSAKIIGGPTQPGSGSATVTPPESGWATR